MISFFSYLKKLWIVTFTRMFIDKLSFIAEFHTSGHFNNDALTTTDLVALGITGNVCCGSPHTHI